MTELCDLGTFITTDARQYMLVECLLYTSSKLCANTPRYSIKVFVSDEGSIFNDYMTPFCQKMLGHKVMVKCFHRNFPVLSNETLTNIRK